MTDQSSTHFIRTFEVQNRLLFPLRGLGEAEEGGAFVAALTVGLVVGLVDVRSGVFLLVTILPVVEGIMDDLLGPRRTTKIQGVRLAFEIIILLGPEGMTSKLIFLQGSRRVE